MPAPAQSAVAGMKIWVASQTPEWFTQPPEDTPATRLRNVEAVGAYAITIEWDDGHHFGIYNWNFLRALCPCPDCRAG